MRKLFKKTMALVLSSAMAITGAVSFAPNAVKTAKAAVTYNAYTCFQINNTWAARDICVQPKQGLNGGKDYVVKKVGDDTYNPTYNYLKQYLVFNALADKKDRVVDAGIKDAKIDKNGTYVMEFTNFDTSKLPLINAKKGDKVKDPSTGETTEITEDTKWNMLAISTDIPTSTKGVTCTNVKVYFDDETTPFATLAKAPHNIQNGDAKWSGNNGYAYAFYIFDTYGEEHGTKSALKNDDAKYKRFPKKSMKIEFTINGIDFKNAKKVVVEEGLMEGQKLTSGDFVYKVLTRSKSDGSKGTVAIAGLSAAGAKKSSVTPPTTVANGTSKYNVTKIASKAFQGNKKLKKIKLNSIITSIGSSAFKKCTKLSSITFNKKVKSIGTSTFEGCTSLKKITLGKKVKSIGKSAFKGCKKLAKISVSQKVKVSKGAFKGCKKTIKVSGKKSYKTYTVKQIKKSGYKKVK